MDKETNEMQIVKAPWWSAKKHYVRRRPYTYVRPTRGMIKNRIRFSEIATRQYGKTGLDKDGLPIVASTLKQKIPNMPKIGRERKPLTFLQRMSLMREMRKKGIPYMTLPGSFSADSELPPQTK